MPAPTDLSPHALSASSAARSSDRLRLAVVGNGPPWPQAVTSLLGGTAWCTARVFSHNALTPACLAAARFDAVVVCTPPSDPIRLRAAIGRGVALLRFDAADDAPGDETLPAVRLPADADPEQLRGALAALMQLRPILDSLQGEMSSLYALGNQLHNHFDEMQRDLTLAARLQRDFLPREMPDVPGLRFATLYRPCSWISGDMLDVFRIDEHHIGFFVMDAMGHGVAAALLTMFIRNAIPSRHAASNLGEWARPAQVIAHLNDVLVDEQLPDCQFVTGWHGVLDTRTHEVVYCNGGHPPALRVRPNGQIERLEGEGCLLGVFAGRTFSDQTSKLDSGDRLLLFSDGLEEALLRQSTGNDPPMLTEAVQQIVTRPAQDFVAALAAHLDQCPGAFGPRVDDVTLVVVEVV